ncbi:hypothetical protein D3C78_1745880 [compost metagenome]
MTIYADSVIDTIHRAKGGNYAKNKDWIGIGRGFGEGVGAYRRDQRAKEVGR